MNAGPTEAELATARLGWEPQDGDPVWVQLPLEELSGWQEGTVQGDPMAMVEMGTNAVTTTHQVRVPGFPSLIGEELWSFEAHQMAPRGTA